MEVCALILILILIFPIQKQDEILPDMRFFTVVVNINIKIIFFFKYFSG